MSLIANLEEDISDYNRVVQEKRSSMESERGRILDIYNDIFLNLYRKIQPFLSKINDVIAPSGGSFQVCSSLERREPLSQEGRYSKFNRVYLQVSFEQEERLIGKQSVDDKPVLLFEGYPRDNSLKVVYLGQTWDDLKIDSLNEAKYEEFVAYVHKFILAAIKEGKKRLEYA